MLILESNGQKDPLKKDIKYVSFDTVFGEQVHRYIKSLSANFSRRFNNKDQYIDAHASILFKLHCLHS